MFILEKIKQKGSIDPFGSSGVNQLSKIAALFITLQHHHSNNSEQNIHFNTHKLSQQISPLQLNAVGSKIEKPNFQYDIKVLVYLIAA